MELAVTLTEQYLADPSSITRTSPGLHDLQYLGGVGSLKDVFVFRLPQDHIGDKEDVIQILRGLQGVRRVDEVVSRSRAKRDEF